MAKGKIPGSLRKRGKAYYYEVTITDDLTGKQQRFNTTIHAKSENEAWKKAAIYYVDCISGKVEKPGNMTVYGMCGLVMKKHAIPHLEKNTVRGYLTIMKRIKKTEIGKKKFTKLRPIQVQDWVNYLHEEWNEDGLASKTVRNSYSFLHMCYDVMDEWGEIERSPCHRIKLPKLTNKDPDSLTLGEVTKFLGHLETLTINKQDYKVAMMLALFCGLRRGEICGLNEDAIDLKRSSGTVRMTRYIDEDGIYEGTPKSKSSFRTVYFPHEVTIEIKKLLEYHEKQKTKLEDLWRNSPALIKTVWGGEMFPNNLWDWLNKFLKTKKMRHFSVHALRHTYTSMLSYMQKDLAEISKSLGHSKISTTTNTYLHLFKDEDEMKKQTAAELSSKIIKSN